MKKNPPLRPPPSVGPRAPSFALALALALAFLYGASDARADSLIITEAVTDPQADHSENAGGNGTPFDAVPGTGTVSSVDEFVELFNAGCLPIDLRGYVLDFLDSTPSRYVFGASAAGVIRFSPGSALDSLRPGGFVLLGNPPGALNNALALELRGPDGALVDAWPAFDGNAASPSDESVTRRWDGLRFLAGYARAPISPLAPPAAAPEPAPWLLAVLSALAAARATRRRAAPATSRRRRESPSPPASPRRASRAAS